MEAYDQCPAAVFRQAGQQAQDLLGPRRVQGCHGLVGQHQQRRLDHQPRDGRPLLLSAGQVGSTLPDLVSNAHAFQRRLGQSPVLGPHQRRGGAQQPPLSQASRQDVVQHGKVGHQVVLLVDNPHQPRQFTTRLHPRQGLSINRQVAGVRLKDARQQV